MKSSLRAKRMARNHKRHSGQPKLNLVSLMDIFTILVFFLMVNSGDVEVLSSDKNISLPESTAEKKPELSLTIKITDKDIIMQGQRLGAAFNADDSINEATIDALAKELQYQAQRRATISEREKKLGRAVIIMGDEEMPYTLLKKIMTTCSAQDYRDINLAVSHIAPTASAAEGSEVEG
ncbi:ExbD/TolR family protein [Dasania marina]|uniref:ExbD/TolR family protein n=1 Tax=Dasania marina TaxID=471499 RepID=UPI00038098E3|nr:biopolymer transporter ExbD [Dasania marina]